ncbi:hypothetical protein Celaphus_00008790, partial [Cervus elaphus hippelaphus]
MVQTLEQYEFCYKVRPRSPASGPPPPPCSSDSSLGGRPRTLHPDCLALKVGTSSPWVKESPLYITEQRHA